MEWIGCTVCEIFTFKLHCDLETGVRGHSRSSKEALFDRAHMTSSSIVTIPLVYIVPFSRYSRILVENCYPPLFIWRPGWGWSHQIYATTLGDEKLEWWAYQMVKEFRWYVQPFWYNTRVWRTDRRTDGIGVAYTRYSILCCRAQKWQFSTSLSLDAPYPPNPTNIGITLVSSQTRVSALHFRRW